MRAATRYGDPGLREELAAKDVPGVEVTVVDFDLTRHEDYLLSRLEATDLLIDATQRLDPTRPVVPNPWIAALPEDAVILDLAVDPYDFRVDPPRTKGIEGIPHGNLDRYVFPVDDPAWDELDHGIDTRERRLALSCYAWPGIDPIDCMQVYGRQIEPVLAVALRRPVEDLDAGSPDLYSARSPAPSSGGGSLALTLGLPRMQGTGRAPGLPEPRGGGAGPDRCDRRGAGHRFGMGFADDDYTRGPNVRLGSNEECFSQDVVLTLRAPEDRLHLLSRGATLVSMLHFPTRPRRVARLVELGLDAISLDLLEDDVGHRLVVDGRDVAWNGLEAAFDVLEREWAEFASPTRPAIRGDGDGRRRMIGKDAVEAATKYGNLDRAASSRGCPGWRSRPSAAT